MTLQSAYFQVFGSVAYGLLRATRVLQAALEGTPFCPSFCPFFLFDRLVSGLSLLRSALPHAVFASYSTQRLTKTAGFFLTLCDRVLPSAQTLSSSRLMEFGLIDRAFRQRQARLTGLRLRSSSPSSLRI